MKSIKLELIMKGRFLVSMLVACLPWLVMAQNSDDLYFIPKKNKKEVKEKVGIVPRQVMNKTVNELPAGTHLVVKDVKGNTRSVDEYNRRYTSRDNKFSFHNDTLLVEEKPYGERGEWVNGFEGSQSDYEYATRLIRFRNPRYAIPVSSPLYWDVVYEAYPSYDWNVYDDGLYAYVFPTYTNRLWWDWRWSTGFYGPGWGFSWGWTSPWYYSGWYASSWYGYYGGYWGGWYGCYPSYGWGGSYYAGPRYHYNNRRAESGFSYRHEGLASGRNDRISSGRTIVSTRDRNGRTGGRVVRSSSAIDRSSRNTNGVRGRGGVYSRPTQSTSRANRVYTRPSSTRGNSINRGGSYNSNRSYTRKEYDSSFSRGSSSRSYRSGSFNSGGGSRHSVGTSSGRSGGGIRRR